MTRQRDAAGRLAAAKAELVEHAGRCARFGAGLDPGRCRQFGASVGDVLARLGEVVEPGGDDAAVEDAARALAKAVTLRVTDLPRNGLDDPGLAFLGAVLGLRRLILKADSAAADLDREKRKEQA